MKWALAGLCGLALIGCGAQRVGEICTATAQCAPPLACFPTPGGFCSRGCVTEGHQQDCPGGTLCTFFGQSLLVCSTPCTTSADCRINYECAPVQGTTLSACRPEGAR